MAAHDVSVLDRFASATGVEIDHEALSLYRMWYDLGDSTSAEPSNSRLRDGESYLNYAIYHDRYQRASDGWKFTERVYEIRYLDTTPVAGSAPHAESGAR